MRNRGITLVELLVVLSVVGSLVVALGMSYRDWIKRYEVEKITKELYQDLMEARVMAVEKNVDYLTVLSSYDYTMAEDRNRDQDIDSGEMLEAFPKSVKYELRWNNTGSSKVICNARGLITPNRTISVVAGADADFDCIKISRTRIIKGKYDNNKCVAR